MIVSLHVTHSSAGGVDRLNNIVPDLEKAVNDALVCSEFADEYVVIRTCNRLEAYVAAENNQAVRKVLDAVIRKTVPFRDREHWYLHEDRASIKHLFTVVCGMDSLIVGENQIQHQVKEAFAEAKKKGHVGKTLNALFNEAMVVGKRVRTETDLNRGAASVGSAAIQLVEGMVGSLEGKNVSIFGAGDMAGVIAKNLVGKSPNAIFVSNRTFERAQELAKELGGTAVNMDRMNEIISRSDIVLVATSAPHEVIREANVIEAMRGRPEKPLMIVDVSVPINVSRDVVKVTNVSLFTMDSLNSIAAENIERRRREISSAEKIIEQELARLDDERKGQKANEIIRMLSIRMEDVRRSELEVAKAKARFVGVDEVMDDMSRAIVKKICADLIKNLRQAAKNGDAEACAAVEMLFGLRPETVESERGISRDKAGET